MRCVCGRAMSRGWGLAAVLLAMVVTGCGGRGPETHTNTPPPSSAVPVPPRFPVSPSSERPGTDGAGPTDPAPPRDQAAALAARFAAAWARPDLSPDAWWADIRSLCDPGFADALRTTDPANIPARTVTAAPMATTPASAISVTYAVATDAGTLVITVAAPAGRWWVVGNDFIRATR